MTTAALLAATLALVIVALVVTPCPASLAAIVTGILVAAITPAFPVAVITWPRAATVYTMGAAVFTAIMCGAAAGGK